MNLNDILSSGHEHEFKIDGPLQEDDIESATLEVEPGYCIECGDQEAELACADCGEDFCEVCSTVIHRVRGNFPALLN